MAPDLYSMCSCGSGKKFKWCCQAIHADIDRAFRQDEQGQHDTALQLMEKVTSANADNPEAWGRRALLQYQNNKTDDAEVSLQKALDLNPLYPFGLFLRGLFRQNEGESVGALMLFRKAAELYAPEAADHLAQVYLFIAQNELKLNRPVAARVAMQTVLHLQPAAEQVRAEFETVFGDESQFPASARKSYTIRTPKPGPADQQSAWDAALAAINPTGQSAGTPRLGQAAAAFQKLVETRPTDPEAWYDLALVKAWLGDNRGALAALDQYLPLEPDEALAAEAAALAAVLRCGAGLEDEADQQEHSLVFQLRDPRPVLAKWEGQRRLFGVQANQESRVLMGCVLEKQPDLTPALAARRMPALGAFFLVSGPVMRFWHTVPDAVKRIGEELQQEFSNEMRLIESGRSPVMFRDVLAEVLAVPTGATSEAEAETLVRGHVERFFEETWVHRPLRSLGGVPPVDAVGSPVLRRKLLGVLTFLDDCGRIGGQAYDFGRLRRKLGLAAGGDSAVPAGTAGTPAGPDIAAMGAAELAGLETGALTDDQLEAGYQGALKLDAREVAGRFAAALVARPPRGERPDRFPWYSHLIQLAMAEGGFDQALAHLAAGEAADAAQNEGRRQNEYTLRRGQVLAKKGDVAGAAQAFEQLIGRAPGEPRYRGTAAEAMLSLKQPGRALAFAEAGLAEARQRNDRDSEEYFKELVAAAKKQGA